MAWNPHREPRPPCENAQCGLTNYLSPFPNDEGFIVCDMYCYYSRKWQKKWNYHVVKPPGYDARHTEGEEP